MNRTFSRLMAWAAAGALGLVASSAWAAITFTVTQTSAGVVVTGSGSINTAGLTLLGSNAVGNAAIRTGGSIALIWVGVGAAADRYQATALTWGTNFAAFQTSTTSGDTFGLGADQLFLPAGYVSGTALSGTATHVGQTLASIGTTPGTYSVTFSNGETFTINVLDPVVPYDIDANTGAVTYAKELNYTSSGTALSLVPIESKLGFGVSASQTRYIRVDLAGGTFASAWSTSADWPSNTTTAFAGTTLAAGGGAGDNFAIFQITANSGSGASASNTLKFKLPAVYATAGNAANVSVTYAMFETATASVANQASQRLYSKTGSPAVFSPALVWSLAPATSTALVSTQYRQFNTGAVAAKALGKVSYGVASSVFKANGTTAVTLADLVSAANVTVGSSVVGGFGAAAATNGLYLDANNNCGTVVSAFTLDTAKTTASVSVGSTATTANVCYLVTGSTAIPASSLTAALDLTALAAAPNLSSVAAQSLGTIQRDGTTLVAPFVTVNPAYMSRFFFTNGAAAPAAWTAAVSTESGVSCTAGTTSGVLAVGTTMIDAASLVGACSGAARYSVTFTIAAPRNLIEGSLVNVDKAGNAAAQVQRLTNPVSVAGRN